MTVYTGATASLDYRIQSDWGAGFVAEMRLTPVQTLQGWRVEFDLAAPITNLWNGQILSHVGNHYTIGNASWNAKVGAGGTVSFGFQAGPGGSAIPASSFELNDVLIVGGQPPSPPPPPPPPPPMLDVADVTTSEAQGAVASFKLQLSAPATQTVTIAYTTEDGTARAGSDYVAKSGTVTIAAGQQQAVVQVALIDDTAVEPVEKFNLKVTSVTGATLRDGVGTATINDPDVAPPQVTVSGGSAQEGTPGTSGGGGGGGTGQIAPGWLHTEGNQILDANGDAVEIRAVNWFGMESTNYAPHGLWTRGYKDMMDQMADLGFNAIRLPFSQALFEPGRTPNGIDFWKNPDLQGLTGLQIMDKVVAYADQIGLRVILDHHRSGAGAGPNESGLWYQGGYTEAKWIDTWKMLADRYAGNDTVIGVDLHNEPHAADWNAWAAAAERAGNAVLAENPNLLILVEGVGQYQGDYYWWGGSLEGVRDRPVELSIDGRLVYSPHDYPNSVYGQPWFNDMSNLTQVFDEHWGFIYRQNIAPILLGEFGSKLQDPKDLVWAQKITAYLNGDLDANGSIDIPAGQAGMSWAWWSWNPNSGDTGGVLLDNWQTVRQGVIDLLDPLLAEDEGGGGDPGGSEPAPPAEILFTIRLDHAAAQALTLTYTTQDGTAVAGQDYVAKNGTITFQPGETSKSVAVQLIADSVDEADETFRLLVSGPVGGTLQATGTILDDDGVSGPTDPQGPGDGEVALKVDNDWGSGAVAGITITNDGDSTANGWRLAIDLPFQITNLWNGRIVSHQGERYVIENASWNGRVAPDASAAFGFQAGSGNLNVGQIMAGADADVVWL